MGDSDARLDPDLRPAQPGAEIVLGCDGSNAHDFTALVGTTWDKDKKRVALAYVRYWDPNAIGQKLDPAATIGHEIRELKKRGYRINKAPYDPWQLHSVAEALKAEGIAIEEMPQTLQRVEADTALYHAIRNRTLAVYPEAELRRHMANAIGIETPRGVRIGKERTSMVVDLAVALSMSHYGAVAELNKPLAVLQVSSNPFYGGPSPWW